jgi:predicted metalloprotease
VDIEHPRLRRGAALLSLLVAIALLLAACSSEDGEGTTTAPAGGDPEPSSVPASPASPGEVLGEVNAAQEERVEAERRFREEKVLNDAAGLRPILNGFWARELAARYGIEFDPPDSFEYYRSAEGPYCGGQRQAPRNAFYCNPEQEEGVAFDLDWFQEYLVDHPGGATTFLILAHEWGHAVQDTWLDSGGPDAWVPPNRELNADCLAGVFLAQSIREGTVIEESGDEEAIFGWLYEVGNSPWLGPGSHGTKSERRAAFQAGLERGTDYCRRVY